MSTWKLAAVQTDVAFADPKRNLATLRRKLAEAAEQGARLAVLPECVLTGYCYESKEEAAPYAEPIPGPSTLAVADDCRRLGIWACFGLLERDEAGRLFNSCALVGPRGVAATYRKIHLPCMGVDRFATPGDRPFAVHDLGGLRLGILICYDGSFPESARVLTLLGADLVVLSTNWPTGARCTAECLVRARALENHIYYAAVDRVGEERGFRFIGMSQVVDCDGSLMAGPAGADETILYATVDPEKARHKHDVKVPGKHEVNRIGDRRPELYGVLCAPPRGAM